MCEGPFFGGEPCIGDKADLRRCNEKRCPGKMKEKKTKQKKQNKHELIYSKNIFVLSYYAVHVSCFLMIILQN